MEKEMFAMCVCIRRLCDAMDFPEFSFFCAYAREYHTRWVLFASVLHTHIEREREYSHMRIEHECEAIKKMQKERVMWCERQSSFCRRSGHLEKYLLCAEVRRWNRGEMMGTAVMVGEETAPKYGGWEATNGWKRKREKESGFSFAGLCDLTILEAMDP